MNISGFAQALCVAVFLKNHLDVIMKVIFGIIQVCINIRGLYIRAFGKYV